MSIIKVIQDNKAEFESKFEVFEKGNPDGSFTLEVGDKIESSEERASSFLDSSTLKLLETLREEVGEDEELKPQVIFKKDGSGDIKNYNFPGHAQIKGRNKERARIRSILDEAIISITTNNK